MEKIQVEVKVLKRFEGYNGFGEYFFYTMQGTDGQIYIWKTTKVELEVDKHDVVILKGFIKEYSEYKGVPQVVLTRCSVVQTLAEHIRWTEEQLKWFEYQKASGTVYRVSYKDFKNLYSDFKTIRNSYDERTKTIEIVYDGFAEIKGEIVYAA